jgi:hypothetical protein
VRSCADEFGSAGCPVQERALLDFRMMDTAHAVRYRFPEQ